MTTDGPIAEPYLPEDAGSPLPWPEVLAEVGAGATCWLVTASPGGIPHVVPVLGVVAAGAVHVAADPGSQKATNLAREPRATLATTGGRLDVVVEGRAARVTDDAALVAVADAYADTHGWQVEVAEASLHGDGAPTAGPGPFHVFRLHPTRAFAFPSEGMLTPTRWRFATPAAD